MKIALFSFFMVSILGINARAASTMTVLPHSRSIDFINTVSSVSSSVNFSVFVVANETKAWNINMKYDQFKLDGSTAVIPAGSVSYTVLRSPCDDAFSYFMPWSWTTVYTATTTEFNTKGTTVTINVNVNPGREVKPGVYRSNLSIELGNRI